MCLSLLFCGPKMSSMSILSRFSRRVELVDVDIVPDRVFKLVVRMDSSSERQLHPKPAEAISERLFTLGREDGETARLTTIKSYNRQAFSCLSRSSGQPSAPSNLSPRMGWMPFSTWPTSLATEGRANWMIKCGLVPVSSVGCMKIEMR